MDAFAPPTESAEPRHAMSAPRDAVPALIEALRLYAGNFPLLVAIALTANAPVIALRFALPVTAGTNLAFSCAQWIVDALVGATVVLALDAVWAGEDIPVTRAFRAGFRRWGPLFSAWFTTNILTGLALIALIVPGLWLGLHYLLVAPVVVLEGRSQARSWELVSQRRAFVVGVVAPLVIGAYVAAITASLAVDLALEAVGAPFVSFDAFLLLYAALWPLGTCGQYVVWRSLTESRGTAG